MTGEKWIPVKERLPESGQHVIIYDMVCGVVEAVYYLMQSDIPLWTDPIEEYINYVEVTHWLPLPDSPKEYGENERDCE